MQGVELEKVEFFCEALGSPQPTYTWLDKDGLDATQKLGKNRERTIRSLTSKIVFVRWTVLKCLSFAHTRINDNPLDIQKENDKLSHSFCALQNTNTTTFLPSYTTFCRQ